MTASLLLTEAMELIADPEHWCQDVGARNQRGTPVLGESRMATQWCADGALMAVGRRQGQMMCRSYLIAAAKTLGYRGLVALNDSTDHETVMLMFKHAIEDARRDEETYDNPQ